MNQSGCGAPIAISVTIAPALLVALHGKLEPSATSGLLSGLPYGGGEPRIIWALVEVAKRATAEKERTDMIEDILWLIAAVLLRSRRSIVGDGVSRFVVSLSAVAVVVVKCEEREKGKVGREVYKGVQRSEEQLQMEKHKESCTMCYCA